MIREVKLAKIGLTMETGTIVGWMKKEGDFVSEGEVLFEVETDKMTTVVEAFDTGYLKKIIAQPGEEVPVDAVIALMGEEGDTVEPSLLQKYAGSAVKGQPQSPAVPATGRETPERGRSGRVNASPVAKRLAQELGVDLTAVTGTGPGGRIGKEDVMAAADHTKCGVRAADEGPDAGLTVAFEQPLSGVRKVVAQRMSESYAAAPHIHLETSADMGVVALKREELNRRGSAFRLTITDFIVFATARALKKYPLLNATLRGERIVAFEQVNIGVATDSDRGLIVPVVKDAAELSLDETAMKRTELVQRVREGRQRADDLSGGTFTVTNLGMFGIDAFRPILFPGQSGILAAGAVRQTAVAGSEGAVHFRPLMNVSLACDHRIVDGAYGARFLQELKNLLESEEIWQETA